MALPQMLNSVLAKVDPCVRLRRFIDFFFEIGSSLRHTDLSASVRAVRVRALIIAGATDPLFDRAHQQALAGALTGSRLVWAQDCGHNPHWEDPAFVAEALAIMLSAR